MTRKKTTILMVLQVIVMAISGSAHEKPLPFLKNINEFSDFSLSITEAELKNAITSRGIYAVRSADDRGFSYNLLTKDGENLIVMFGESGKCGGIQRMLPTPKEFIEKQVGEAAYKRWMDDLDKIRLAEQCADKKRAEQDGTGQPATRPESKSEGSDKPQPESEGRSR